MQDLLVFANSLRFHYLDWGGGGPDLLLVHPTGFLAHVWEPLAARLTADFHVVALDTRGHGDTDKPDDDYHWTRFAADLGAFVDATGLAAPTGIGHSAGATSLAILEGQRPGSFRRLVLLDPVLFIAPMYLAMEGNPLASGTLKRRRVWPSREAIFASYRSKPPFQSWDEEILWAYITHGTAGRPDGNVELKCPPVLEARMYVWGPTAPPIEDLLPRVHCPVLLIRGRESAVFGAGTAERTAGLLPDCRLVTLPGSHFFPFEHPSDAEAEILSFLAEGRR